MTSLGRFEGLIEEINQACENFDGEEKAWIHNELMEITGLNSIRYYQGVHMNEPYGVTSETKTKARVIHNIFIEKGLESPLENFWGFRKMKHNPDKKKRGKKKKGGRRRI